TYVAAAPEARRKDDGMARSTPSRSRSPPHQRLPRDGHRAVNARLNAEAFMRLWIFILGALVLLFGNAAPVIAHDEDELSGGGHSRQNPNTPRGNGHGSALHDMRLVGFNNLQARSAYQPIVQQQGKRFIASIGHHGGR